MNEISKIVESGYNKIAESYYSHRDINKFNKELDKFVSLLPSQAHILDAGCGAGIPTAKFLVQHGFKVTGIDLSETMLKPQFSIFKKFFTILKTGGILRLNTGISDSEGSSQFFGVPMYWSNHNPKTTLELVKKAGFSIIFEAILERGREYQYWIFGKKEM